jgi:hypothetical protein
MLRSKMTETAMPPAMVDNDVPLAKVSVNGAVKEAGSKEDWAQSQSDRIPNPARNRPRSYL